jgi:hypothetical protein
MATVPLLGKVSSSANMKRYLVHKMKMDEGIGVKLVCSIG